MHLYETIQDFPIGIEISGCRMRGRNAVATSSSAFTFKRTTQVFPGQRWEMELEFLPQEREAAGRLEAFILSLRGGAGKFRMGDPFQSMPLGQALGQPLCAIGNVQGNDILHIKGLDTGIAQQFMLNDKLQIGNHYYAVLSEVGSCPDGCATVRVWPALRESYPNDTAIITRNARALWNLSEDSTFSRDRLELYGTTLTCVEAV